ncbi:hypothetical protein LguiB_021997 [Lonicera macranthoides]
MSASSLLCTEDAGNVVSSGAGNRISGHPSPLLSNSSDIDSLFDSEPHYMPPPDYIRRCQDRAVDLAARQDSINWILKVHAHYQFKPVTAFLSINYLDRFLSTQSLLENGWPFQLLSVACLSLAAKMEETRVPLLLDLQMFDPKFVFEPKTVQRMELLVMANLNWKLLSVTPFDFQHYFTSKLHFSSFQPDPLAHVLSDLVLKTTRTIDFLGFSPSTIAAAAVILAAGQDADVPEMFYERERMRSCHQLMAEYLVDTCQSEEQRAVSTPPVSPAGVLDAAACTSCDTRSSQGEPPSKRGRSSASDALEGQP